MKLDFLKYFIPGHYAEKDSKEGLNCIREFEAKADSVKNKAELEILVQEYEKRIESIGTPRYKYWIAESPLLLGLAIPNPNIGIWYIAVLGSIQLWDWTQRVRKFKTDNNLWNERWHSSYPYRQKFREKSQCLLEEKL